MSDQVQIATGAIAAIVNRTNESLADPQTQGPANYRWRVDKAEIILLGFVETPSSTPRMHLVYFDGNEPPSRNTGDRGFPIETDPELVATLINRWLLGQP